LFASSPLAPTKRVPSSHDRPMMTRSTAAQERTIRAREWSFEELGKKPPFDPKTVVTWVRAGHRLGVKAVVRGDP
jgi:hypothetical protein